MHGMQLRETEMFCENRKEKWPLDKLPDLAVWPNVSLNASDGSLVREMGFLQAIHPTQNYRKMSQAFSWRMKVIASIYFRGCYQPAVTLFILPNVS